MSSTQRQQYDRDKSANINPAHKFTLLTLNNPVDNNINLDKHKVNKNLVNDDLAKNEINKNLVDSNISSIKTTFGNKKIPNIPCTQSKSRWLTAYTRRNFNTYERKDSKSIENCNGLENIMAQREERKKQKNLKLFKKEYGYTDNIEIYDAILRGLLNNANYTNCKNLSLYSQEHHFNSIAQRTKQQEQQNLELFKKKCNIVINTIQSCNKILQILSNNPNSKNRKNLSQYFKEYHANLHNVESIQDNFFACIKSRLVQFRTDMMCCCSSINTTLFTKYYSNNVLRSKLPLFHDIREKYIAYNIAQLKDDIENVDNIEKAKAICNMKNFCYTTTQGKVVTEEIEKEKY